MFRIIKKTYKFRVYCNKTTEKILCFILECCRWEYNLSLSLKETSYKLTGNSPSKNELIKFIGNFITINPFLGNIYSQVRQDVVNRVDFAYSLFFKGIKAKRKVGKPKFQFDGRYNSFTFSNPKRGFKISKKDKNGKKAKGNWKWLKLSLAKKEYIFLKVKYHRNVQGKVKTLTIKRNSLDQWFVTVVSEIKVEVLPRNKSVGIDFGIKNLAHTSDNEVVENPMNLKAFKDITERIVLCQQQLQIANDKIKKAQSIKKKTLKQASLKKWYKIKVARLKYLRYAWKKYNNCKTDYLHKESHKLLESHNVICIEDFKPKKLMEKATTDSRGLRRNLSQASCTTFKTLLFSKALINGKHPILVPAMNTTKCCSSCGRMKEMILEERTYECENKKCKLIIDRDLNASYNIHRIGLKLLKVA